MSYYLLSNLIYFAILNVITNRGLVCGLRIGFKYQHNRQELETTKKVRIAQNKCQNNSTQIFVHSAATTSGKYYERRQLTRETWAQEASHHGFRVTFVLGEPKDNITQNEILDESNRFGDILQFGFIDDYHNLTLKAIAILRWTTINCLVGHYIIKTDDDIVVNTERLKLNVDKKVFLSGITGKMFKNSVPLRNNDSEYANKWLVPKEIYDKEFYPPYLSGAAYVMSTDVIEKLYDSAINNSPVLDIDDLYITGIIADKFNIGLHNSPEFSLTQAVNESYCGFSVCKLYTLSTLHGCNSVNATFNLWNSWKNSTFDSCLKKPRSTTSGKVAFFVALSLLITFFISIVIIGYQYFAKNNALKKWQRVAHS